MTDTEPLNIIPYQEIIDDLNQKLKSVGLPGQYRLGATTKAEIGGRWGEGYRLEDFKWVHTVTIAQWRGTSYERYLRPSTLYRGSKFPGYRNQRIPGSEVTDGLSESGQQQIRDAARLKRRLFPNNKPVKEITGG